MTKRKSVQVRPAVPQCCGVPVLPPMIAMKLMITAMTLTWNWAWGRPSKRISKIGSPKNRRGEPSMSGGCLMMEVSGSM